MNDMRRSGRVTSREIFKEFFKRSNGEIEASPLFSKACFDAWVRSQVKMPMSIPRAFQCAIRNVVTGANGAKCFTPEEEAAALKYLRVKRPKGWPCFEGDGHSGNFGWKHIKGWHEKNTEQAREKSSLPSCLNPHFSSQRNAQTPSFYFTQLQQQLLNPSVTRVYMKEKSNIVQTIDEPIWLPSQRIESVMDQLEAMYDSPNLKTKLETS